METRTPPVAVLGAAMAAPLTPHRRAPGVRPPALPTTAQHRRALELTAREGEEREEEERGEVVARENLLHLKIHLNLHHHHRVGQKPGEREKRRNSQTLCKFQRKLSLGTKYLPKIYLSPSPLLLCWTPALDKMQIVVSPYLPVFPFPHWRAVLLKRGRTKIICHSEMSPLSQLVMEEPKKKEVMKKKGSSYRLSLSHSNEKEKWKREEEEEEMLK